MSDQWEQKVANGLAFLRRRLTGEYPVDDFGYDSDLTEHVLAPPLRVLYKKWFRVQVRGVRNVPDTGPALIVANHAGVVPLDASMLTLSLLDHHPKNRALRLLAADLVFGLPFFGEAARKAGFTLACADDAARLLSAGELVGVFPEGYKGLGKSYGERYKLQRFGRGGFVATALAARAPIIPCTIVGSEEIYPKIADIKIVARALNLPYFPITPFFPALGPLGLIPLPSKWIIAFGPPINTANILAETNADPEDPMTILNLTDRIRETIQTSLHALLTARGPAF